MPSPEHEAVVKALQENALDSSLSFREQRTYYDEVVGGLPLGEGVKLEEVQIAGREADFLSVVGADSRRVVLHLHGGGYVLGSNRMYREFATRLSRATQSAVLTPHYRLAPEDPFPAAIEDSISAFNWLLSRGFRPSDIIISGDSAGGGLALATLIALRDRHIDLPAGGVFISPWTDLTLTGASIVPGAVDDPIMDKSNLANMAEAYARDDLKNPLVSPFYGEVNGFPKSLVFAGTRELLLDDARRLVKALGEAGVVVEYEEGEGLIHCWPVMAPLAPESIDCLERIGQFTQACWAGEPS